MPTLLLNVVMLAQALASAAVNEHGHTVHCVSLPHSLCQSPCHTTAFVVQRSVRSGAMDSDQSVKRTQCTVSLVTVIYSHIIGQFKTHLSDTKWRRTTCTAL